MERQIRYLLENVLSMNNNVSLYVTNYNSNTENKQLSDFDTHFTGIEPFFRTV